MTNNLLNATWYKKAMAALKSAIRDYCKQKIAVVKSRDYVLPIKEPEAVRLIKIAGEVIRRKELCQITGLSMTTLWRQEREGNFPARIRLTNHSVGWRRSDIEAWLATRPTA